MNNHLHDLVRDVQMGGPVFMQGLSLQRMEHLVDQFTSRSDQAVCFFAGEFGDVIGFKVIHDLVRLPFPVTYIEFAGDYGQGFIVNGYFCIGFDEGIFVQIYSRLSGCRWMYGFSFMVKNGANCRPIVFDPPSHMDKTNMEAVIIPVLAFLSALNCSNIKQVESRPSEKLQASRRKKGKLPLYSTWTLAINIPGKSASENDIGGTHASPRVHLRRGHPRQYAPGKYTWVQPCVVGNTSSSMVNKDYAARYGADT